MAYFEQPAIVCRSGGQINVYYGGKFKPDGPGHGHVRVTGGPLSENIVYWRVVRLSSTTHGKPTMNGNDLRDHLTDF